MSATESTASPRLQEFQSEVDSLKVTGGKANPERTWVILGALLMIAGIVLTIVSYSSASSSAPSKGQTVYTADFAALGTLGLTLAVVGAALFIVMSLRRYFVVPVTARRCANDHPSRP